MAITVCEILASQQIGAGGGLTGRRQFMVWDSADGGADPMATPLAPGQAVNATKVDFGQKFSIKEPWVSLTVEAPGVTAVEQSLLATNYTATARDERRYTWDVVWDYEFGGPTTGPAAETIASVNYSVQFTDCWRTFVTEGDNPPPISDLQFPPNGDAPFNVATGKYTQAEDIGGQPIDAAGEPVSCLNRVGELRVDQFVSTWDNDAMFAINSSVGRRNSKKFYGHDIGTVLYLGATASVKVIGSTVPVLLQATVTHSFAFDDFYHLRQMCGKLSTDGSGGWSTGNSYFGDGNSPAHVATHGFPVVWIQPFPKKVSFDAVLGTTGE